MVGSTDKQRSLFLKGFKLSNSGGYEDPTYLTFKLVLDLNGALPIDPEFGTPPSPLFKDGNYVFDSGSSGLFAANPFGQLAYQAANENISYYSAQGYLVEREANMISSSTGQRPGRRADILRQFKNSLTEVLENSPWFIQSIEGIDSLIKIERGGYVDGSSSDFNTSRTSGKTLTFNCLESLDQRITALAEMYKQSTFDPVYMRELLPRNLRRFKMFIFVTEVRNFFKTSRLISQNTVLQQITNFSNLLPNGQNPGSNLGSSKTTNDLFNQNIAANTGNSNTFFQGFVGGISDQSGINSELAQFRDQSDQTGIKPVLIIECSDCEFDFEESSPFAILDAGIQATEATQKFKVHVGRVRTKYQFPNIRKDGKHLILADSWDQFKSSAQKSNNAPNSGNSNDINSSRIDELLGLGGELITNMVANSVNDMINEGAAAISGNLAQINQTALGNIYSFTPGEIQTSLRFNTAQNFLNQLGNVGNPFTDPLPNPQSSGLGGPPERAYPAPGGDAYTQVPGRDLGVPDRVYPDIREDVYQNVPGADLGVPDRIYPPVEGDVYTQVPGVDLGVPERIYPNITEDVYATVPGRDLGVPERIYPPVEGDVYAEVPGRDLGVPGRVYPDFTDDVYAQVPGRDLGVPDRNYGTINDDVYRNVPGRDLGGVDRNYGTITDKVYPETVQPKTNINEKVYTDLNFASDFKGSEPVYPPPPTPEQSLKEFNTPRETLSKVYEPSLRREPKGDLGQVYPPTTGDFNVEPPMSLGNLKAEERYNISLGKFNPKPSDFE